MQAGAAQQPWAAWTLSATGRWNETWRPLTATADWVMDENHRGSWPEIAEEATPAYFTPPAGLFVAATVEALFGLQPDLPAGVLKVAPSFPDHWPKAEVNLPDYQASYSREENRLTYTVESAEPLARQLEWAIPIGQVKSLKANGKPLRLHLAARGRSSGTGGSHQTGNLDEFRSRTGSGGVGSPGAWFYRRRRTYRSRCIRSRIAWSSRSLRGAGLGSMPWGTTDRRNQARPTCAICRLWQAWPTDLRAQDLLPDR